MKKYLYNVTLFILGLLVLSGAQSAAQSTVKLYGTVTDRQTGKSLYRANVQIKGTGYGAATNDRGYYQIEDVLEGPVTVTASFIGYADLTKSNIRIPKDQPVSLDFALTPIVLKMKAVEVHAEPDGQDLTSDHIVILKNDINRTNYSSVGEILQRVPGVQIQNTGTLGGSKKISIHGSQTNQVLVLLDGMPLNDELGGDADLSQIPLNIIEKIEVYKGGRSARFGSGAVGGVINISTQKTFDNHMRLTSGCGSFGFFRFGPGFSGTFKNFGYLVSYNHVKNNGDFPYSYRDSNNQLVQEDRINADILSRNLFTGVNFTAGSHFFSLQAQALQSDRGLPGKIDAWTAYARVKNRQEIFGAEYEFTRPNFIIVLSGRYSNAVTENSNLYPQDAELRFRRYYKWHYNYMIKNYILQNKITCTPSHWLRLTMGYTGRLLEYRDEDLLSFPASPPIDRASDQSHGVYLHQDWHFDLPFASTRLAFTPVVRYDEMRLDNGDHSRYERQWSPGLGCFLATGKKNTIYIKTGVSKSFRVPTLADMFYQDVRTEGKPDLAPEKCLNRNAAIGARLNLGGIWNAKVSHFLQTIEDLIVWRMGSFEVFRPFNTDAELSGTEYSIGYSTPNDHIELGAGLTHLNPLNKSDNITTRNRILPYRAVTSCKAHINFNFGVWQGSVLYRDVGERFINEANTKKMPSYQIMDVNFSWTQSIKTVELVWKMTVINVLDREYKIFRDMPMPKREWRAGIDFKI